jgi:hypothetical protein
MGRRGRLERQLRRALGPSSLLIANCRRSSSCRRWSSLSRCRWMGSGFDQQLTAPAAALRLAMRPPRRTSHALTRRAAGTGSMSTCWTIQPHAAAKIFRSSIPVPTGRRGRPERRPRRASGPSSLLIAAPRKARSAAYGRRSSGARRGNVTARRLRGLRRHEYVRVGPRRGELWTLTVALT